MEQEQGGGSFVQRLRPEPFAYFEVYNPWTQNRLNQRFPEELSSVTGDVNLGRMAGNPGNPGDSPVWRFEVERVDTNTNTGFKPLRYVYMADPTGSNITYSDGDEDQDASDIEVFFGSDGATVAPGTQALVGTRGFGNGNISQVFMGRRMGTDDGNLMLDQTTRLALNATNDTVSRFTGDNLDSTRSTSIVFIDQSTTRRKPSDGYRRRCSLYRSLSRFIGRSRRRQSNDARH